ncbi:MAG: DUF2235 domain-containing protein [Methylocystis sp.]|uniref:DUF2235 domain-containing protein n=3 Tax=Methylocystis sp. TaxID=1911079 RepID=UPI003D100EC9
MAKKIILLADGTGNGLLVQVSNICHLSKALDFSRDDQLVYYIPGVGTQGFKPLAMLDGATGLGVPSNVRKLYRFLSWNWEPGAAIYLFGFSRGAFTIRTLVDFVANQGLLPTYVDGRRVSHREMVRNSEAAWRAYCAKDPARRTNIWVKLGFRKLRDAVLWVGRKLSGESSYETIQAADPSRCAQEIAIDFMGLFDTVEAYGVPVEEMREGVHRLIWPINFGGDHSIWENVKCVRQALSLDDERRTFHPIRVALKKDLGDKDLSADGPKISRVKEVWFAGVHSDIGGGYPDDSSAHVPLLWMLGEVAKSAGQDPATELVFRDGALEEFCRIATPFGPLHDSRSGLAILYRYDPRAVSKTDAEGNPYFQPTIHHSVVERLVKGHEDYAPIALGAAKVEEDEAEVEMPDGSAAKPKAGPGYQPVTPADEAAVPAFLRAGLKERIEYAKAALNALDDPKYAEMEIARDFVWLKRILYFFFFGLFLVVLLLPIADELIDWIGGLIPDFGGSLKFLPWLQSILDALSNVFGGVGDAILSITPAWLTAHVQAALEHPLFVIALILIYFGLNALNDKYQDSIQYHARRAWNVAGEQSRKVAGVEPGPLARLVRWLRNSPVRRELVAVTRPILPVVYALAFLVAPVLIVANRAGFNFLVGKGSVCEASNDAQWLGARAAPKEFHTSDPCWASGWLVERGAPYRLTINVDPRNGHQPWLDQLILTDPYGFDSAGFALSAATVLRRWPSAAWFHPIARIGSRGEVEWPLIPSDGGGALPSRGRRCTRLPIRYDETPEHAEFCKSAPNAASCSAGMALSVADPLPSDELDAATRAWTRDTFELDGRSCSSPFPRTTFMSEFIARDTGELFLFVNDAAHIAWPGRDQIFYKNNTGTATITIERLPRAEAPATTASSAP